MDAILTLHTNQGGVVMDTGDKYFWKTLIDNGDVVNGWSYYGGSYEKDAIKTIEVRNKLKKGVKVDWDKTRAPYVDTEESFESTFSDGSLRTTVVTGILYLEDGSQYRFGMEIEDFTDLMKTIFNSFADKIGDPFDA